MLKSDVPGYPGQKNGELNYWKLHVLVRQIYLPGTPDVNRVKLFANAYNWPVHIFSFRDCL